MKIRWRYKGDEGISIPRLVWRKSRTFLRQTLGIPLSNEEVELLGHRLIVRQGTVPRFLDKDYDTLCSCLRQSSVVFDIGCNVGYTALLGLLHANIQEMVLVDASSEALSIAAKNIILNGLSDRVRFVRGFVGDKDGDKVEFFTGEAAAASSAYIDSFKHTYIGKKTYVETRTVDGLVSQFGIQPDFVKIDVEGAEDLVLLGASELARGGRTRFLVEVHHHPQKHIQDTTANILKWCADVDCHPVLVDGNLTVLTADAIPSSTRYHMLIQPK